MKLIHQIIFLIFLFNIFSLKSQDRLDRSKISFIDSSLIIKTSTGWIYNKVLGEWISHPNVISEDKSLISKTDGINFKTIQTKKININNKNYYILIISSLEWFWKYPSISEGYNEYDQVTGYIFDDIEYNKLQKFLVDSNNIECCINTSKIVVIGNKYDSWVANDVGESFFYTGKFNNKVFLDLIQYRLTIESQYTLNYDFFLFNKNKGNIQFILPKGYRPIWGCKFPNDEYFETTFNNFNKIIIK